MEEDIKNEIINKAGFPLYVDYWEKYLSKLTGEQLKEVFKIVFHFNKSYEVLPSDDLAVDMVVTTIIDNIKRDAQKRIKQSRASRKNGIKGGRPPKKPKAKDKQKISKPEGNVNVNVDKDNNDNKDDKSKSKFTPPTLQEVKDYCLERKNLINADKFINYYQAKGWLIGKVKMKDWKAAVRTWEGNEKQTTTTESFDKSKWEQYV